MRLDSLRKKTRWEGAISRKLKILKHKAELPRLLERKEFFGTGRKILFSIGLVLPKGWQKPLSIFAAAGLLLLLFFPALQFVDSGLRFSKQILGTATTGVEFFEAGRLKDGLLTFQTVAQDLENSNSAFLKVLDALQPGGFARPVLLEAAAHILAAVQSANDGVRAFRGARLSWDPLTNTSSAEFYQNTKTSRDDFLVSAGHLENALQILTPLNPEILPSDLRARFVEGRDILRATHAALLKLASLQEFGLRLLGGAPKTYLLIFQNNNEARATGGFIGTYGLLDFENGRMRISKIETVYNLDGQLREPIAAPGPLQRQVSGLWGLRDSNWFVDFPKSGEKILSFLAKENGAKADGIISFTPDVFEKLLRITGSVAMPEYDVTLTAENFRSVVQRKTSLDYDRAVNEPKKFLADFAPRFLVKLQDLGQTQWVDMFGILTEMIAEKQILLYSRDRVLEDTIRNYHADGGIWPTAGDYLAIYHSNVGGGKTDQNISQKVDKKITIVSGGLAVVNLKITRTHQGFDERYFPKNLDYMRILAPRGATLLSAAGFDDFPLLPSQRSAAAADPDLAAWDQGIKRDEATGMYIGTEAGYTEFGNWLELLPGQSRTVELTYEIPIPDSRTFTFLLQKQPGSRAFDFSLDVNYLPGKIARYYPPEFVLTKERKLRFEGAVKTDMFYGLVGE